MKKGGYQILDLQNIDFTVDTPQTVVGAHGTLEATHKPIYVSGLVVGSIEQRDGYVDFAVNSTSYVGTLGKHTITISDTDEITIGNVQ